MITTKNMYEEFISKVSNNLKELEETEVKLINSQNYLLNSIFKYKDELNKSKFPLEKLILTTTKLGLASIKNPRLKTYMYALITVNRELNFNQSKQKSLKRKSKVTYEEYSFIIRESNKSIINLLLNGYILSLGILGNIFIRNKKNRTVVDKTGKILTKKRVDWGASNKEKERVTTEGARVFNFLKGENDEYLLDEHNQKIGNGGIKTIVYSEKAFDTWIYWEKKRCGIAKKEFYSFVPSSGPTGFKQKLSDMLRLNVNQYKKYFWEDDTIMSDTIKLNIVI